jgi:hypothetical protein
MGKYVAAILAVLLIGCASTPEDESEVAKNDVIDDYIVVSELEPVKEIKSSESTRHKIITENYILVTGRRNTYLLVFNRACRELNDTKVTPDVVHQRNTLTKFDTYRGCQIRSMYALNSGQAQELLALGETLER